MLKYALVENALALNPNGYVAVVSNSETKDLDAVINFMVSEGTGLTRPQAFAYFEKLIQTVEFFVEQGHRVTTPLFRIKPSISGVFTDTNDSFDSSRHSIHIRTSSGKRLVDMAASIKPGKVDAAQLNPIVRSFVDGVNKTVNSVAFSDSYGTINGKRLKFDAADSRLGVFFIPANDPSSETRITGYVEIMPSKLHFILPALAPDTYRVVVRNLSRNGLNVLQGELKYKIRVD